MDGILVLYCLGQITVMIIIIPFSLEGYFGSSSLQRQNQSVAKSGHGQLKILRALRTHVLWKPPSLFSGYAPIL